MKEFLPAEHQLASTCTATISTVCTSLRAMQAAALDVRDAVAALRELHKHIEELTGRSEADAALRGALDRGDALIDMLASVGLYESVPIEML